MDGTDSEVDQLKSLNRLVNISVAVNTNPLKYVCGVMNKAGLRWTELCPLQSTPNEIYLLCGSQSWLSCTFKFCSWL